MKKLMALLLAAVMVLAMAACAPKAPVETTAATEANAGTEDASTTTEAPADEELEPVTLKMWFHGSTVAPEASKKVMDELNKYLGEKINVTLEPIWGTWGDFDTTVPTALQGGDDVDIYFTCNWSANEYNKYARDGYYVKLDDLLPEYGADLLDIIPEGIWECAKTNGIDGMGVYAVPGLKDTATQVCWDVNGTLLAKLGYDVDAVCSGKLDYFSDEFKEMMQKAKDVMGDNFYPLLIEPTVLEMNIDCTPHVTGDLGNGNVLSFYFDREHPGKDIGSKIVNKFGTPEFEAFARKTREYAELGFISPSCQNITTAYDFGTNARNSGDYLFATESYAFGCELDFAKARGIDVRMVPGFAPYMDATSGQGAMMAISQTCKNPERALMFLNLLNTDPYVMTTLNYGLEGYTYTKNDDGTITFIDDARANYTPWTFGCGNVRILPPTDQQGVDFWDRFSAFYDSAETLPYKGFIFDASVVDNETAAVANVYAEYAFNLCSGAVDVDENLPAFLDALEKAGIDTIVDAANEQLAEYMG